MNSGEFLILDINLVALSFIGAIVASDTYIVNKKLRFNQSNTDKELYPFLPWTTVITVVLVLTGLVLNIYYDLNYALLIFVGMSIALLGDITNTIFKQDSKYFIVGSILFIISFLVYSIALINVSSGITFWDMGLFLVLFLFFCLCLKSTWNHPNFQVFGKYRVITSLYPFMLIFLVLRAILTLLLGVIPILNAIFITIGIIMIFVTDMEFSIDKFFKPIENKIGPVLYPFGQLFIGLSAILVSI